MNVRANDRPHFQAELGTQFLDESETSLQEQVSFLVGSEEGRETFFDVGDHPRGHFFGLDLLGIEEQRPKFAQGFFFAFPLG